MNRSFLLLALALLVFISCTKDGDSPEEIVFDGYNGFECDSVQKFLGDYLGTYSSWEVLDSTDTLFTVVQDCLLVASDISTDLHCKIGFSSFAPAFYIIPNQANPFVPGSIFHELDENRLYVRYRTYGPQDVSVLPPIAGPQIKDCRYTGYKQ